MPSIFRVFSIFFSSLLCLGFLIFLSRLLLCMSNRFSRSALVTTQKLDRLMAAAPNIGFSCQPNRWMNAPAASGMPRVL